MRIRRKVRLVELDSRLSEISRIKEGSEGVAIALRSTSTGIDLLVKFKGKSGLVSVPERLTKKIS